MQYNVDVEVDDDEIVDHIKSTMDISDVFDENDIKNYINRNYTPEDVFSDDDLSIWAIDHGYVKG